MRAAEQDPLRRYIDAKREHDFTEQRLRDVATLLRAIVAELSQPTITIEATGGIGPGKPFLTRPQGFRTIDLSEWPDGATLEGWLDAHHAARHALAAAIRRLSPADRATLGVQLPPEK
jgi:hypothetical protein